MALKYSDRWVWDFWLLEDKDDYHIFYLQAPRALIDERLRHFNATIGHAVSKDLTNWRKLPGALQPGPQGSWDDLATWTGSVIRHEGTGYMFYTGLSSAESGRVQRIGLATSNDMVHWQKHPANPLITTDARWYELLDRQIWHDQAWRDPWVFQHPQTGEFHALITARANTGKPDERGVIGQAVSDDLLHWQVVPPVTSPGEFGHMEVPQLSRIGERYYLLFSTSTGTTSAERVRRTGLPPVTGTHYLVADNPLGPFTFTSDKFLVGDPLGKLYAGKLVQDQQKNWKYLAFRMYAADGSFIGELSDPLPVHFDPSGNLCVDAA